MFTCDDNLVLEHVLRGGNSDFSLEVMFRKLRKASFLFYYFYYFFLLYNIVLVLPYIDLNPPHECTCVTHPEPPSHLPPHPIPLGHPSAPAPSTQYHASNLDWRFVSHMILYMLQCHYLTLALSHRVHKTVLYICVSFAVSRTGLLLPSF